MKIKVPVIVMAVVMSGAVEAEGYKSFSSDLTCIANEQWLTHNHIIKIEFDFDHLVMRETDKLVCADEVSNTYKEEGYNVVAESGDHDAYDTCVLDEIDVFLSQNPTGKEFVKPRYAPFRIDKEHSMYLRIVRESLRGEDSPVQYITKNYNRDLKYWSWVSPSLKGIYYTDLDYDVPCKVH
jgi:hypothetical protein